MAPDQVLPNNFPNTLANCAIRQYARGMTTSPDTQRNELARDIFLSDNSSGPDKVILGDWADLEQTEAGASYAHRIANGLIAKGYRKPRTISTEAELEASADGTVLRDWDMFTCQCTDGHWQVIGDETVYQAHEITLPATVLWEPGAGVGA